jgi:hypothetical protein
LGTDTANPRFEIAKDSTCPQIAKYDARLPEKPIKLGYCIGENLAAVRIMLSCDSTIGSASGT